MKIVFLITTYNRQKSCQRLVDFLQGQGDIVVLNDGCDYIINNCEQHFLSIHNGKQFYWSTVVNLFSFRGVHDYYFMLPDDFLPVFNMVDEAIRIWRNIADPQKICLNLFADRIGEKCWTKFTPVDMGEYYKTGWMDMCFMCESDFFSVLQTSEIKTSINTGAGQGSGVGATISRKLYSRGRGLYQVKNSLVIPQEEHCISQMYNSNQTNNDKRGHRHRIGQIPVFTTRNRFPHKPN
jgi:hypothetical protein